MEGVGGAWKRDPALWEARGPALQVCRGGGAAAAVAAPPPVEKRNQRRCLSRCLGRLVCFGFSVFSGGLLGESGAPHWRPGCAVIFRAWCPLVPVTRLHSVPSLPRVLRPRSPRLCGQQGWVVTNSRLAWLGMRAAGERSRWQTTPNCQCPRGEHPVRAGSVICGAGTHCKPRSCRRLCGRRSTLAFSASLVPRFSDHDVIPLMKVLSARPH